MNNNRLIISFLEVNLMAKKISGLALILLIFTVMASARPDEVRVYEEPLTLPTYRVGEPQQMPFCWGGLYPLTTINKLTDELYERTYRALWLENEYVKVLVLPELGGRLHGAQDKTNGYQFFYNQTTIKPALVGASGAWISGGIEWNFIRGHHPNTFREIDSRIQQNPDGSRTIWTGEIQRPSTMRWSVGNTVHPGRNWVETKVRLYNCTPYMQTFWWWATAAIRATEEYQAVFPGEIVTGHGKRQFSRWPIQDGLDKRYWKNTPRSSSFFAWQSEDDYFGGYSPENKAGFVHLGDHHIIRGKKLWTWGTAPSGRIWEKILTDGDLPYFEPQLGGYSDNQPDWHWIMPGETKVFSHFWFPVRDIGVFDYANMEGALNLDLEKGRVTFGWSPTGKNKSARVVLTLDGKEIFTRTVDADPAAPFVAETNVSVGADIYSLALTVFSANGDTLLSYQHPRPANPPFPKPTPSIPEPDQVKSTDELFVFGDHLEKFRQPTNALRYYNEALKRDPADVRNNTALGLMLLKQGKFEDALEHFQMALERDPSFTKAYFYQGITQLWMGKSHEAEKCLNRAAYDLAYYAAAHLELARLAASQGRWGKALEHIERSIKGNGDNAGAYAIKSLILNRMGRGTEALEVAAGIQKIDPLEMLSLSEYAFALTKLGRNSEAEAIKDTLLKLTRGFTENHLSLAIEYARCGLYREAINILEMLPADGTVNEGTLSPMQYYYQAYYHHLLADESKAENLRSVAAGISLKYGFPNRLESFPVLSWAVDENPRDAGAWYLLGNLHYSKAGTSRATEAVACWEKAVALDPNNAVAQRNLGVAAWRNQKEPQRAVAFYEAAIKADPNDSRTIQELELVYEMLGLSVTKRIAFLEKHVKIVSQDDSLLNRLVRLYVLSNRCDDALYWLNKHHFHTYESRYVIHQYWVESNLQKGDIEFAAGNYQSALEHYKLSLTYPLNLEVGAQPNVINARKNYKVATALEALGRKKEADDVYTMVLSDDVLPSNAFMFYRGKALEKLGRDDDARRVYEQMLDAVNRDSRTYQPQQPDEEPFFEQIAEHPEALIHYKRSLALDGLGKHDDAQTQRKKAFELDPIVNFRAFTAPRAAW